MVSLLVKVGGLSLSWVRPPGPGAVIVADTRIRPCPRQRTEREETGRVKGFYAKHDFAPAGGEPMGKDARLGEAMKRRLARYRESGQS
jgi:hypothetical protein